MKRVLCLMFAIGLVGVGAYALHRTAYAQEPSKDDMRDEIEATLSKFVDAANRADTATVTKMISTQPQVSLMADGEIYQGAGDVQYHTMRMLGQQSKFLFQLGAMSIANVHGLALATGPYTLRARTGDHSLEYHGAVTFLLEKEGRRHWVVVHLHRSTVAAKPHLD